MTRRQPEKRPVGPLVTAFVVVLALLVFVRRVGDRSDRSDLGVIQSIRSIHAMETQYYSQYGRYAQTLDELRPWLPDDLASGTRNGYRYRVEGRDASYEIHADPLTAGRESFYSDQTMLIRWSRGPHPATPQSRPLR